jgi:hypothetical protein
MIMSELPYVHGTFDVFGKDASSEMLVGNGLVKLRIPHSHTHLFSSNTVGSCFLQLAPEVGFAKEAPTCTAMNR